MKQFQTNYSLVIFLFLSGIALGILLEKERSHGAKTIEERAEENYMDAYTCSVETGDTLGGTGICEQCWLDHGFPYDIQCVTITQEDKINALFH